MDRSLHPSWKSASGLVAGGLDAWHERTVPGPGTVLTHGTFGHAGFVVAGNNGTILCSEDGVEWAAHTTHSNHFFYGVAYGKGIYVVAGANQGDHTAGIVLSSTDGKAWTRQQLPSANAILMNAAFLDNRFVLVGAAGVLFVSTNAVSWRSMSSWGDSDFAYGVTAGQGRMVVVGGEVAQIGVFEEDILWKVLRVEGAFKLRGAPMGTTTGLSLSVAYCDRMWSFQPTAGFGNGRRHPRRSALWTMFASPPRGSSQLGSMAIRF